MTNLKKKMGIVLAVIVLFACAYVIAPGFTKQSNVYIADYAVSEDGSEMTLTVCVATSVGYVRKVSENQQHAGKLYLDFYSAFGGINGSWSAKSRYTIRIDEDTEMIALYRGADCYESALEKDENGVWQRVKKYNSR